MPKRRMRRLIIDVGAGDGSFVEILRKRHPEARVIGVDPDPKSKARLKKTMGEFFRQSLKDPERVKGVWLNHVSIYSADRFKEFKAMVARIPPGTPIILTVRKEKIEVARNALELAGLRITFEKAWNPKMLGSTQTKAFYKRATEEGLEEKRPIRVVAIKPIKPR